MRYESSLKYLLLAIDSDAEALRTLPVPDRQALLAAISSLVGIIVTTQGCDGEEGNAHFVSRFFAPWAGIDEDPVTGSAHSMLGPYWSGRLGISNMRAVQLSARRGVLGVAVLDDAVVLQGSAVVVLEGRLFL